MKPIVAIQPGSPAHIEACVAAGNHELARSNDAVWQSLPYVGRMEDIELRNCSCTSTLCRLVRQ